MAAGEETLHIGIDDTDSKDGMCTTYVGAVLFDSLRNMGARMLDHPYLVRLNPNCPYKTRGNAAIALHVGLGRERVEDAKKQVLALVERLYEHGYGETQPGVAFILGEVSGELARFAEKAVRELVSLDEALELASSHGAELHGFNGGRGRIGALAAASYRMDEYTFEAIAYRVPENWGTVRRIDSESVRVMDEATRGETFDNIDPETGELRIAPHTPCPVLAGVRAVSAEAALRGLGMVRFNEPVERVVVFKTNQATDKHLVECSIAELRANMSAVISGVVCSPPYTIPGGHTFIRIRDAGGEIICAAYEPTREFRNIVRSLVPGDRVRVMGGVKMKPEGLTLNMEKLEILALAEHYVLRPPLCPCCGRRMKSAGRDEGYRCKRCGKRLPRSAAEKQPLERKIKPGFYEVPPSARRHLTRPLLLHRV
ncbi:MAG: tRNA(Ile)(2)-agmatinylcytidine synthase [Aigarchaeota archaeon]|nr:tRNA(Ile)(2)-agmatinylcytidine synthase [Candidatus Pelearchaeum maunauluense]